MTSTLVTRSSQRKYMKSNRLPCLLSESPLGTRRQVWLLDKALKVFALLLKTLIDNRIFMSDCTTGGLQEQPRKEELRIVIQTTFSSVKVRPPETSDLLKIRHHQGESGCPTGSSTNVAMRNGALLLKLPKKHPLASEVWRQRTLNQPRRNAGRRKGLFKVCCPSCEVPGVGAQPKALFR